MVPDVRGEEHCDTGEHGVGHVAAEGDLENRSDRDHRNRVGRNRDTRADDLEPRDRDGNQRAERQSAAMLPNIQPRNSKAQGRPDIGRIEIPIVMETAHRWTTASEGNDRGAPMPAPARGGS